MLTWRQTQIQRGRKGDVAVYERVSGDGRAYRVWIYDKTRYGRETSTYADSLEQALDMAEAAVLMLGLGDAADRAVYGGQTEAADWLRDKLTAPTARDPHPPVRAW